ncbi:hypothetical protein CPB86DRAFT_808970 [Serendipita vermifera]|nr:hypothetical protein CPB86DRAFT_808970 [Serendipita vermifera]
MDSFNWADSIRATLGHCLPCVKPNGDSDDEHEQSRGTARRGQIGTAREELERLLDGPMTDHEEDVETMSLHSNVGRAGKNKRTKRQKKRRSANNAPVRKSVRVFGIDLFGRRPIALEETDEEEGVNGSGAAGGSTRPRTISTSTLDSDAAPLADDAITDFTARAHQRWAPSQTDEELRAEEALERERIEKDMRKEQRRERKQMKRLAEQGAFAGDESGDFEGFPGSGYGPTEPRSPTTAGADDFGPFVAGEGVASSSQGAKQRNLSGDKEEEEDADFDASAYTKKRRPGGEGSRSGSGSGSHTRSRSRTSASVSTEGTRTHHQSSKPSVKPKSPLSEPSSDTTSPSNPPKERKSSSKSGTKKSKRTKSSVTSSSATQSLPSPALTPSADVQIHSQEFDGVPGGLDSAHDHLTAYAHSSFPSPSLSGMPSAGFPSTGFGKRSTSGLNSTAGVALARRGDN